jgi:hypothetical protein
MSTKNPLKLWDNELHKLAERFGKSDQTEWLVEYTNLKEDILEGCSLGRYANGLQIADAIIDGFGGYEYLATLFAKMSVLDELIRSLIEEEKK